MGLTLHRLTGSYYWVVLLPGCWIAVLIIPAVWTVLLFWCFVILESVGCVASQVLYILLLALQIFQGVALHAVVEFWKEIF